MFIICFGACVLCNVNEGNVIYVISVLLTNDKLYIADFLFLFLFLSIKVLNKKINQSKSKSIKKCYGMY